MVVNLLLPVSRPHKLQTNAWIAPFSRSSDPAARSWSWIGRIRKRRVECNCMRLRCLCRNRPPACIPAKPVLAWLPGPPLGYYIGEASCLLQPDGLCRHGSTIEYPRRFRGIPRSNRAATRRQFVGRTCAPQRKYIATRPCISFLTHSRRLRRK